MTKDKLENIIDETGLNPDAKEGMGSGMMEGLLTIVDPIGILAQYTGQKMGYDVRTIGGVGFFGKADYKTDKENTNIGKLGMKLFISGAGVGCWFNPLAWPYLVGAEIISTGINIYTNIRRYIAQGTLKKGKK